MCFRSVTECLSQLTGGGVDGAHHGNGESRKADEVLKAAQAEQAESAVRVGQGPATD